MKIATIIRINELLANDLAEKKNAVLIHNQDVKDYRKAHDINGWDEDKDHELKRLVKIANTAKKYELDAKCALDDWQEHDWH